MNGFLYTLQWLPYVVPWMLVQIAGIGFAVFFYGRYRVPALLVLSACLLQIFDAMISTLAPYLFFQAGMGGMRTVFIWLSLASVMMKSSSFCLLIVAVFVDRQPTDVRYDNLLPVVTATVIETSSTSPQDKGMN